MKINLTLNPESLILPLPIYSTVKIAEAVDENKNEFAVFVGLDKNMISQIKTFSLDKNDTELQKNTGDRKRFGEGSYEDWYGKNRTPFALVHTPTNALAALIWFGPKPPGTKSIKFQGKQKEKEGESGNWHTPALRSYIPFRGKNLMRDFFFFTTDVYRKKFSNIYLWLGLDSENKKMLRLGEALGFEVSPEFSDLDSKWLVMTKKSFN